MRFSMNDFIELDLNGLLEINGGGSCSRGSGGSCSSSGGSPSGGGGTSSGGGRCSSSYGGCSSPAARYGGGKCSSPGTPSVPKGNGNCSVNNPLKGQSNYNEDYETAKKQIEQAEKNYATLTASIDSNKDKKYVCDYKPETDYRCDNWVQEVLSDAGFDYNNFYAGDAKKYTVENHISDLKASGRDYTTETPTEKGVYVVMMNDGHSYTKEDGTTGTLAAHTGILVVTDGNKGSYFVDNSSGNNDKTGGIEKTYGYSETNSTSQAVISQFGYDSFYFQKVN